MNQLIKAQNAKHGKLLEACQESILAFGKVCMPTMFTVKSPQFHKEIASVLEDDSEVRLNIIAPRGHAKSSIVAGLFPLWHIFFSPGPQFVVLVSKTEGHAIRLLQTIKNALDYSIPLRQMVGYWGEHSARVWKNNEVVLKDGSMILCRGTGQMVVGLKHLNQRPTLIILDDPEDMNNTKTAESMEFNLRWLLNSLIPCRDPLRGRIVVIGTPQHERGMIEVLKEMGGWHTLHYKALQDDGTALWPEWMSVEKLAQEKAAYESINRVSSFYREYQCQIIGDEDQLFKPEYLQTWEGFFDKNHAGENFIYINKLNGETLKVQDIRPVTIFLGIDPASTLAQTSDYSTIVPIAVDRDLNRFVLPYFRKHVTPLRLADSILEWFSRYNPNKVRIESVGYQEMLREYLRSKQYMPGLEIKENPRTSKSNRLEALEPPWVQKKIFLMPNMQELKDELYLYPRGKHDDLLDGLYYANKGIYKPQHVVEIVGTKPVSIFDGDDIKTDWMCS